MNDLDDVMETELKGSPLSQPERIADLSADLWSALANGLKPSKPTEDAGAPDSSAVRTPAEKKLALSGWGLEARNAQLEKTVAELFGNLDIDGCGKGVPDKFLVKAKPVKEEAFSDAAPKKNLLIPPAENTKVGKLLKQAMRESDAARIQVRDDIKKVPGLSR
ncbi:MAG: hypothetical protein K2W95_10230 [Candidatus Obscuribacterales bacterium]|nr:hypothetical protein [Candidatus Obscuribacterales bacterium]